LNTRTNEQASESPTADPGLSFRPILTPSDYTRCSKLAVTSSPHQTVLEALKKENPKEKRKGPFAGEFGFQESRQL
jgi:hypothetical protein